MSHEDVRAAIDSPPSNQLALIHHLPDDLLEHLFRLLVRSAGQSHDMVDESVFNFAAVCRRWRQVAIELSILWTSPPLSSPQLVRASMERSKTRPLSIRAHFEPTTQEQTLVCLRLCLDRDRVQDFQLRFDDSESTYTIVTVLNFSGSFPSLARCNITLGETSSVCSQVSLGLITRFAPQLQHLILKGVHLNVHGDLIKLTTLTVLIMDAGKTSVRLPTIKLLHLLRSNTSLQQLKLWDMLVDGGDDFTVSEEDVIVLSSLEHLVIHQSSHFSALRTLMHAVKMASSARRDITLLEIGRADDELTVKDVIAAVTVDCAPLEHVLLHRSTSSGSSRCLGWTNPSSYQPRQLVLKLHLHTASNPVHHYETLAFFIDSAKQAHFHRALCWKLLGPISVAVWQSLVPSLTGKACKLRLNQESIASFLSWLHSTSIKLRVESLVVEGVQFLDKTILRNDTLESIGSVFVYLLNNQRLHVDMLGLSNCDDVPSRLSASSSPVTRISGGFKSLQISLEASHGGPDAPFVSASQLNEDINYWCCIDDEEDIEGWFGI